MKTFYTIEILRALYRAHLSELRDDDEDGKRELTDIFNAKMETYVKSRIPNAVFEGEIPNLLFDETDDEWYYVDENTTIGVDGGPYAYRVTESLGSTSCIVCQTIHGQTLPIEVMEIDITAPPFHPNCRGWVEVLDRDGNVLFVIGREKAEGTLKDNPVLDGIQLVIDALGLIPIVGEAADGVNALYFEFKGNGSPSLASFTLS